MNTGLKMGRYILSGQTAVPCEDLATWAPWLESHDLRVRLTRVGPHFVSTIFLGLDYGVGHTLLLFETMAWINMPHEVPAVPALGLAARVMPRTFCDYQTRCSTWDEAIAMHAVAVAHFQAGADEIEELFPELPRLQAAQTR